MGPLGLCDEVRRSCAAIAAARAVGGDRPRPRRRDRARPAARARPRAPLPRGLARGRGDVHAHPRRDQLRLGLVPHAAQAAGVLGLLHGGVGAGGPLPLERAVVAGGTAGARRRARWPRCWARSRPRADGPVRAGAATTSAPSSASARRSTSWPRRTARPSGSPSSSPAGMPFFDDRGFYKRAQITANDLTLAGVAEFDDLDRLTIFADNLVPHVLRVRRRAASTTPELAARIDAGELLEPGGEEREIRACAVHACEPIAAELGVPPRIARHVAVEPRPGAALQGGAAPPHADGLLLSADGRVVAAAAADRAHLRALRPLAGAQRAHSAPSGACRSARRPCPPARPAARPAP